ncbi:MAG: AAA family ATPase [Oscillospiraceae bacterium]|nr:AAA family ATPase [Oscillospiraceae bacterium]
MPVKINTLELENVKRIRAVQLTPAVNGLTIIGGNNNQGKTSVLDAICWLLGGNKYQPSNAQREGALTEPMLRCTLSNGLVVERKGKNAALKVIDPQGNRAGQKLLDSFLSELALDLPKFMQASDREKADTLLRIIGVGEQLTQMEAEEKRFYDQRTAIGQIQQQKAKFAAELPNWENLPDEPVSAADLIAQQQAILARNGQRQQWRHEMQSIDIAIQNITSEIQRTERQLADLRAQLDEFQEKAASAHKAPEELQLESTAELEANIADIDRVNAKIRDNQRKAAAEQEAADYQAQYNGLTDQIEKIRADRRALLNGANLPLPGLSVDGGKLLYQGKAWDCMSGSEQLRVATAIVRCLNPECGFVLLDKLEQMDMQTLADFGTWLETNGLQAIATRVSTGDECSIIIEDGWAQNVPAPAQKPSAGYVPGWNKAKEG